MPKKKDATDKGVSSKEKEDTTELTEEKEEKKIGTGHASAIEAIASNVAKQHFDEIGEELPDEEEEPEGDGETDEDPEAEETEDEQEEEEEPEEKPKSKKVKIKVDGEEKEVTEEELIRSYQKNKAADKRLEEAAQIKKEIDELRKSIKQPPEESDADEDRADTDAKPDFKTIKANLVQAIQYGEDDDVEEAFEELLNALGTQTGATPKIDKGALIAEVKEELKAEDIVKNFGKAPEEGGYKDLQEDPRSYTLVQMEVDKLLKEGEPNAWETYQKAGDSIREFLGRSKPTPGSKENRLKTAEDKAMEEKRNKKRQIDSIDTVSAAKKADAEEEEKESPSDIIANMAKSRPGQQLY